MSEWGLVQLAESLCGCSAPNISSHLSGLGSTSEALAYRIDQCASCDLAWTWPLPAAAVLDEVYSDAYYTSKEAKFNRLIEAWTRYSGRTRAARLLTAHVASRAASTPESQPILNILDIGCGRGVLLEGFLEYGHVVLGIEREGSGFDSNANIETLALTELIAAGRQFDIVVLWHVLEHLQDPSKTLSEISQLLNSTGSLYIEVPNFASLQARVFGSRWFHLDIPRHLYHFTPASLTSILETAGFKVQARSSFSFDQNLYGFLQSALNCIPLIPENHLYSVLKSKFSIGSIFLLTLYSPIVALLLIPAVLELLMAQAGAKGTVISMQIKRAVHD